jgi:hypothetical protein
VGGGGIPILVVVSGVGLESLLSQFISVGLVPFLRWSAYYGLLRRLLRLMWTAVF